MFIFDYFWLHIFCLMTLLLSFCSCVVISLPFFYFSVFDLLLYFYFLIGTLLSVYSSAWCCLSAVFGPVLTVDFLFLRSCCHLPICALSFSFAFFFIFDHCRLSFCSTFHDFASVFRLFFLKIFLLCCSVVYLTFYSCNSHFSTRCVVLIHDPIILPATISLLIFDLCSMFCFSSLIVVMILDTNVCFLASNLSISLSFSAPSGRNRAIFDHQWQLSICFCASVSSIKWSS